MTMEDLHADDSAARSIILLLGGAMETVGRELAAIRMPERDAPFEEVIDILRDLQGHFRRAHDALDIVTRIAGSVAAPPQQKA